jgi:hypothetical protein
MTRVQEACLFIQLASYKAAILSVPLHKVPPPEEIDEEPVEDRKQCGNSIGPNRKLCIPPEVTYRLLFSNHGVIIA